MGKLQNIFHHNHHPRNEDDNTLTTNTPTITTSDEFSTTSSRPASLESTSSTTTTSSLYSPEPHIFSKPMAFLLREHILDMIDDQPFLIKDIKEKPRYKVYGKNPTKSKEKQHGATTKRRTICDMDENPLFTIKKAASSLFHHYQRLYIYDAQNIPVILLKYKTNFSKRRKLITVNVWKVHKNYNHQGDGNNNHCHHHCHYHRPQCLDEQEQPWMVIKGDLKECDFVIIHVESGEKIAIVKQQNLQYAKKKIQMKGDEYLVKIMNGNNVPLLLMLVLAIDEFYRPDHAMMPFG